MKYEAEVRELLIENTIRLIAEGGFEKATTRAITYSAPMPEGIKLNEVYIYRLFGSKERLYEEAFDRLDHELVYVLLSALKKVERFDEEPREQIRVIFSEVWRFLLDNEVRCRSYIRFYYSVYFRGVTLSAHNKLFSSVVGEFAPLFKEEADVKSVMHSILTTMLDFAVRIFNGDLADTKENELHIFNVIHSTVAMYQKRA